MRTSGLCALATLAIACEDRPPDPALATPLRTAHTLLDAYHLDGLSEDQIKRRVRRGIVSSSERPVDEALLRRCLLDFDPTDARHRGWAVFLAGALAARQGRLAESIAGDRGSVYVPGELVVVLERADDGWKIDLSRSVPAAVRTGLGDR